MLRQFLIYYGSVRLCWRTYDERRRQTKKRKEHMFSIITWGDTNQRERGANACMQVEKSLVGQYLSIDPSPSIISRPLRPTNPDIIVDIGPPSRTYARLAHAHLRKLRWQRCLPRYIAASTWRSTSACRADVLTIHTAGRCVRIRQRQRALAPIMLLLVWFVLLLLLLFVDVLGPDRRRARVSDTGH